MIPFLGAKGSSAVPPQIALSPAVNGKNIWDLQVDGPLVILTNGTWSVTFLSNGFLVNIKIWSGGGAGGGAGISAAAGRGNTGGDSSFLGMLCKGGQGAGNARPPAGVFTGANGSGLAIATGGDININGNPGTNGSTSGSNGKGGTGAGAPNGGGNVSGANTANISNGSAGSSPAGGGAGGASGTTYSTNAAAGGGGESGAYSETDYIAGELPLTTSTLILGAGGSATTSNMLLTGGAGKPGKIIIT